MSRVYSPELRYVIEEALDSAEQLGEEFNSLHLLFALYMLDNSGGLLLTEEGFSEEQLLPFVDRSIVEPEDAVEEVMEFAEETSEKYRSREVNCLHLVIALCRHRRTIAFSVLEAAGVQVPKLRSRAIALLVDMPKRYVNLFEHHRRRLSDNGDMPPSASPQPAEAEPKSPAAKSRAVTSEESGSQRGKKGAPKAATGLPPGVKPINFATISVGGSVLSEVATDLVEEALAGRLEPVIGRDAEMEELADILNKRKANNPLVIGPPGVGKTALVEGLAWKLAHEPDSLPGLEERRIWRLDVAKLMKGTHLRGAFSERIDSLRREVAEANGRIVLFFDELHAIAQGNVDGSQEISQELKQALAGGSFPCIGATTTEEYRKHIERDAALARRFHVVELAEPDRAATLAVLDSMTPRYLEHHQVELDEGILSLVVQLGDRYMRDRFQPDKSLMILDLACARARRVSGGEVTEQVVAEVLSKLTGVPTDQLVLDEAGRYLDLEHRLSRRIIGHSEVLARIAEALRRNVAGFGGERPMGSFLFVGPTGVGKTEIAKVLASELFGSREAMIRLDMSEYAEPHSVAKLIGAPPGYVGFQEGGVLTDAMRRKPFQLVLFDEIEKAHADVHQLLLQILDDGRLSDNLGRTTDFTHAVIILTSNMGSRVFDQAQNNIGFGGSDSNPGAERRQVLDHVRKVFAPELFNRIDEKIVFSPLSRAEVLDVARLLLKSSAKRLRADKDIRLVFGLDVPEALSDSGGFDPRYGARPMRRAIQAQIEGPLASLILRGDIRRGETIYVSPDGQGGFTFSPNGD
jgi:ATP-dependent Clp protease ATP-binding subunit ClpC